MSTRASAPAAVAAAGGKQFEPRYRTQPRSDRGLGGGRELQPEEREKTLFVGNLDKRVTEGHLMQLFSQFGELTRVHFLWHHHGELRGQPRGFVFVQFKTKEAAAAACAQVNGVDLAGRSLVVRFAEDKDPKEAAGGGSGTAEPTFERRRGGETNTRAAAPADYGRGGGGGGRGGYGGSSGRGGHGSGYGGRDAPIDRYAYVPAPIPSSGFAMPAARPDDDAGILAVALSKVRALEAKLAAMAEERAADRRRVERASIDTRSAEARAADAKQRAADERARRVEQQFQQAPHPHRQDYVHPSRRAGGNASDLAPAATATSQERARSPDRRPRSSHSRSRSRSRGRQPR